MTQQSHQELSVPGHINYGKRKFPCTINQLSPENVTLKLHALTIPDGLSVDVEFFSNGQHCQLNGQILNRSHRLAQLIITPQ